MKIMMKKEIKNGLGKMRKQSRSCVIRYHNVYMLKNSEQYYQRVLESYMSWQNENELVSNKQIYKEKFKKVEHLINGNIKRHEPFINITYDDLNDSFILDSNEHNDNEQSAMINPDLIDFNFASRLYTGYKAGIGRTTVNNILLPNDQFFEMCHQLNKEQQQLFNFMMRYAIK